MSTLRRHLLYKASSSIITAKSTCLVEECPHKTELYGVSPISAGVAEQLAEVNAALPWYR